MGHAMVSSPRNPPSWGLLGEWKGKVEERDNRFHYYFLRQKCRKINYFPVYLTWSALLLAAIPSSPSPLPQQSRCWNRERNTTVNNSAVRFLHNYCRRDSQIMVMSPPPPWPPPHPQKPTMSRWRRRRRRQNRRRHYLMGRKAQTFDRIVEWLTVIKIVSCNNHSSPLNMTTSRSFFLRFLVSLSFFGDWIRYPINQKKWYRSKNCIL